MQKITSRCVVVVCILIGLAGCATVQDVQRSTDLIRTDNELARILAKQSPDGPSPIANDLTILASQARREADTLKRSTDTMPTAIAYYRIAATAYWQARDAKDINNLFEVADSGTDLCIELGDKAPDRDCMFLQLVIPFAGLESQAYQNELSKLLDTVNFNDTENTSEEIKTMKEVGTTLNQTKPLVEKILSIGKNNLLLSHPGMRKYYCDNAKIAWSYYDATAAVFVTKVNEFHRNFTGPTPALGITVDEARSIRELGKSVPAFCRE